LVRSCDDEFRRRLMDGPRNVRLLNDIDELHNAYEWCVMNEQSSGRNCQIRSSLGKTLQFAEVDQIRILRIPRSREKVTAIIIFTCFTGQMLDNIQK